LCGLLLVMPFYTWRVGANVYVCLLMHACECQPRPIPIHLRYLQLYLCAAMRRLCVCRLISITKPAQLTCYHNWRTKLKILCRRQNKAETENCDHNCSLQDLQLPPDPCRTSTQFHSSAQWQLIRAVIGRPSQHWQVNANIVRASRINWY